MRAAEARAAGIEVTGAGLLAAPAQATLRQVLAAAAVSGWRPAVLPDDTRMSLGAAVAADVHGHNHAGAGSFGHHVRGLQLRIAEGRILRLSRSQHRDAFWATIGGLGLTGAIIGVQLQLRPLDPRETEPGSAFSATSAGSSLVRTGSLAETLAVFGEAAAGQWHDPDLQVSARLELAVADPRLGAGLVETRRLAATPAVLSGHALSGHALSGHALSDQALSGRRVGSRFSAVRRRQRLIRYQFAVPENRAWLLSDVLRLLRRAQVRPARAVLDRFGVGNVAALSFPRPGWTLTLDLPGRPITLGPVLATADLMLARYGGRVLLTPDSRLDPDLLAAMYPRLAAWRAVRDGLNPSHRLSRLPASRLALA